MFLVIPQAVPDFHFQFPVGMSNRSYDFVKEDDDKRVFAAFNSPWECRIGLTGFGLAESFACY